MAYTSKVVNGVVITLTPADQVALAAKDAANWASEGTPPLASTMTLPDPTIPGSSPGPLNPAEKLARLASTFGLTVVELKAEIARP